MTILNNQHVIDALDKLNARGKATSILCFGVSTLYAKIPYDKLLKAFNELIDFCFKGGDGEFIYVDGQRAIWTKHERSGFINFTKSNLKKAAKYLLKKGYFKLGNRIFRQIIGIPVGLEPAHYYESRCIRQLRKSDIRRAWRFANAVQSKDDY